MKQKIVLIVCLALSLTRVLYAQNKTFKADNDKLIVAKHWIETNKSSFVVAPFHTFKVLFSNPSLAGETFRFYQMLNDVQVYNAELTIHVSNDEKVTHVANSYDKTVTNINTTPTISEAHAFRLAYSALNIEASSIVNKKNELFVYTALEDTKLVRRVYIKSSNKTGAWEVIIDAHTGAVLSTKDVALYYHKHEPKKKKKPNAVMVTGAAMIYNTDPLTATKSVYGGEYVDNGDATNAALDAARTPVTLLDIELSGGQFRLKGPYVEIAELEVPNKGLFIQSNNNFEFNRSENGFEAANAYYHLDKSLRYVKNDLGINIKPSQNGGVLRFDPHGSNGEDQSYYTDGTLIFGEGCVDDAEDADVILHELGHGLHDWLTNSGFSQVDGLSEGLGDYWANSYKRSLGLWDATDPQRNWLFGWDAHNDCWQGRTTEYDATYPTDLKNNIYDDGQMFSGTLMDIWETIGRTKTDKAVLLGMGMTNINSSQNDAIIAIRQAAIDMGEAGGYTDADINVFNEKFLARGYSIPDLGSETVEPIEEKPVVSIYPNPAKEKITVRNITESHEVAIYNVLGQKIASHVINEEHTTIDVANLISGAYFVKINGLELVFKLIKE